MSKPFRFFSAIYFMFFLCPSYAAIDVESYEKYKVSSREKLETHVSGVGEGYSWANTMLKLRGSRAFYCPPRNIAINADAYINIIDMQIKKMMKNGSVDYPIELILFVGLTENFPCSEL